MGGLQGSFIQNHSSVLPTPGGTGGGVFATWRGVCPRGRGEAVCPTGAGGEFCSPVLQKATDRSLSGGSGSMGSRDRGSPRPTGVPPALLDMIPTIDLRTGDGNAALFMLPGWGCKWGIRKTAPHGNMLGLGANRHMGLTSAQSAASSSKEVVRTQLSRAQPWCGFIPHSSHWQSLHLHRPREVSWTRADVRIK